MFYDLKVRKQNDIFLRNDFLDNCFDTPEGQKRKKRTEEEEISYYEDFHHIVLRKFIQMHFVNLVFNALFTNTLVLISEVIK